MANITPMTPLPAAPSRADGPVIFNQRADPFIASLPPMVVEFNVRLAWIGDQVTAAEGYKNAAAASAAIATAQASIATGAGDAAAAQVAQAKAYADNAAASATAAESAPGSIGNLALIHSMTIGMMRRP